MLMLINPTNEHFVDDEHPEKGVVLYFDCVFCGETESVTVSFEGYQKRFMQGGLVQNCFPELSPAQRDIIAVGMCLKCWKKTFGEDEEAA